MFMKLKYVVFFTEKNRIRLHFLLRPCLPLLATPTLLHKPMQRKVSKKVVFLLQTKQHKWNLNYYVQHNRAPLTFISIVLIRGLHLFLGDHHKPLDLFE